MKVSLITPRGKLEVEIPAEAEVIRIEFSHNITHPVVDVAVDATWLEGRDQDVPVAQHLVKTWIGNGGLVFGMVLDGDYHA